MTERTGAREINPDGALWDIVKGMIQRISRADRMEIRTSVPVKVVQSASQPAGYDPATQLVSLEVQCLSVVENPEVEQGSASVTVRSAITLANVPVAWPRTTSGFLTFPLHIGDTGTVAVMDRPLARWLKAGQAVDPGFAWTHSLADAVFTPGLSWTGNRLDTTDQTATVLHGTQIKIGAQATSPAVLGDHLVTAVDAFVTALVAAGAGPAYTGAATAQQAWDLAKQAALSNTVKIL